MLQSLACSKFVSKIRFVLEKAIIMIIDDMKICWCTFLTARQDRHFNALLLSSVTLTDHASHYNGVLMGAMASQITSLTIVYSSVYSGADQRKHKSSASLTFVRGIHWWPVNSPHKGPVTRKMLPLIWWRQHESSFFRRLHLIKIAMETLSLVSVINKAISKAGWLN